MQRYKRQILLLTSFAKQTTAIDATAGKPLK
jgi:hypothetical protein